MATLVKAQSPQCLKWFPSSYDPIEMVYRIQFDLSDPPYLELQDLYSYYDQMEDDMMQDLDWAEERFDLAQHQVTIGGKQLLHLYRLAFGDQRFDAPDLCYIFVWDDQTTTIQRVLTDSYYQEGYLLRQVNTMDALVRLGQIYYEVVGVTSTGLILALNEEDEDELDEQFQPVAKQTRSLFKGRLACYQLEQLLLG